ncbi:MAG: imidazolonepropionase-like amidohydrolase [Planctomycetota bacterium]|jgi:imidazolonepropionase-like amidohydrolase
MNHSLLRIAIACTAIAVPALSQDLVAIKAKTILTITGPSITDGVILLQNGRIQKIAKAADVEIPWSAQVIDASDKVVMPTYVIAHSNGGMRGANESMQNVPWLSVADAIDPASTYFEGMLRNGVGTIHVLPGNNTLLAGSGMVVRPFGRTVEDMTVAANTGMKLSLMTRGGSRLQKIREMRRAIAAIREYLANYEREKAEFEKEQAAGAIPADKKWEKEIDRKQKAAVELIEKKLKGWLYVPSFAELDEALRMSKDLDLNMVLGANLDEAMPLLAKLKHPVVLDAIIEYYETDPETRKEEQHCSARMLADAGVPFALSLGSAGPTSYPWWQIGTCMRNGLTRQQALEALTMVPAKMLGLDDQVGSLAVGKLGNIQILSGDPTSATSWVETVVLEGEVVYERKKDPRLKYLFEAAEKAAEPQAANVKDTKKSDTKKKGEGQ